MKKLTPKENAALVAKTINEINSTYEESKKIVNKFMRKFKWYKATASYNVVILNQIITTVCKDNEVTEKFIRTVAKWDNEQVMIAALK